MCLCVAPLHQVAPNDDDDDQHQHTTAADHIRRRNKSRHATMDPNVPFDSTLLFGARATTAADPAAVAAPSEGITAIAARIHERAVQLANEQDALQAAEQQLEIVQAKHVDEQQRSQQVRSQYLKSMLQANSMELECCKIQDLIAERVSKTKKLKQQELQIMEQIAKQEAEWEAVVEGKLVQHKVRQMLYQKHLQGAIHARNEAMARRKCKIGTSARLAAQLKRDRKLIIQEEQQVQANMMRMTDAEDEANKQVESLALQVRTALTKVSQTFLIVSSITAIESRGLISCLAITSQRSELRTSLREAQQAYQNAHDEADKLGHEYRSCRV